MSHPIYPCIWFDGDVKAAADYYCSIFRDSKILSENEFVVMFELNGTKFMGLKGNPNFTPTDTHSFVVNCDTQEEIDHYWDKLTADGGQEVMCGWLKDKYGIAWQIVPSMWEKLINDPEHGQRAIQAMMKMKKLVIAELENA